MTAVATTAPVPTRRAEEGFLAGGLRRFLRRPANRIGLAVLAIGILAAFVPQAALPVDPTLVAVQDRFMPPAWVGGTLERTLGTDNLGRDLLSRLVYAGRFTIAVTILSAVLAGLVGITLGMIGGYFGRWADVVVSRLVDIQMAFPSVFLAIAVLAIAGSSFVNLVLVLVAVDWAAFARVIRSSVLTLREREFVEASRAVGAGDGRILLRHLLPNLVSPIIVLTTYAAARILLTESALSFLGLGITPPATTWGGMVGDGRNYLYDAWWVSTIPGVVIAATVLAVSFVGDGLRDALDPRMG